MSNAKASSIQCYGSNSTGDYFRVDGVFHVKRMIGQMHEYICLDDRSNVCQHVLAVKRYVDSGEPMKGAA